MHKTNWRVYYVAFLVTSCIANVMYALPGMVSATIYMQDLACMYEALFSDAWARK